MPSRKKATRSAQLQPQPVQSDYDTDTANVTDTATAMAPPPQRSNTELNMLVLRRYIPDIERITAIAPFAVVYTFSPETQQWEKSGHEGTLFVCQLSAAETGYPRYNVVILNRKSMDNFITEPVSSEDIEITEQYVILQVLAEDGKPNIYGLWIFSDDSDAADVRELVANAIQECAVRAEQGRAQLSQNGHSHVPSYNLDGSAEEPSYVQHDDPPQTQGTSQQIIDLNALFGKRAPDSSMEIPEQQSRFVSTADTDFFRSSHSPAVSQQQQSQPPPQQNSLLDLFKNAKKG